MKEWKIFAALVGIFLVAYFIPLENPKIREAIMEAFRLLQWYAREHTLACVVPALFIAGGITSFLSPEAVMRYFGPQANKLVAYSVAAVSGTILAVCSCSVLPMFAGIYTLGAGIGPATAFLYSGPAINILAIFLTARVLGFKLGLARALGAIGFAYVIGLLMASIFDRKTKKPTTAAAELSSPAKANKAPRPLWRTTLFFSCMVLLLVFSDWYKPGQVIITTHSGQLIEGTIRYETRELIKVQVPAATGQEGLITLQRSDIKELEVPQSLTIIIYNLRWYLTGLMFIAVAIMSISWLSKEEFWHWMSATWDFTKLLVPLLYGGVFLVGFISVLLPEKQIAMLVGNNGLPANIFASIVGAFFYFATLTEIPIVEALMKLGMAKGPALALLLAGPALSLPNMLVIRSVMGNKKTIAFICLIVIAATVVGMLYGAFF
jgi:uncharacterized membrane protein YraQ (UPF0718 family)